MSNPCFRVLRSHQCVLGLTVLSIACDPVRPGDFRGDFPDPLTLDFSVVAGLSSPTASLTLYTSVDQAGRYWERGRWPGDAPSAAFAFTGQTRIEAAAWAGLAGAMSSGQFGWRTGPHPLAIAYGAIGMEFSSLERGPDGTPRDVGGGPTVVAGGLNYLLVGSDDDYPAQPIGPSGPMLPIKRGFQLFRRTCTPENPNVFSPVPLDTVIEMLPVPVEPSQVGIPWGMEEAYLGLCGLVLTPPDLGQTIAALPAAAEDTGPLEWWLTWAADSTTVYYLHRVVSYDTAIRLGSIGAISATTGAMSTIAKGYYGGPLQIAQGGRTLLVNEAIPLPDASGYLEAPVMATRVPVQAGATTVSGPLFLGESLPGERLPVEVKTPVVLSPDGSIIAYLQQRNSGSVVALADVETGGTLGVLAPSATPRAFSPTGQTLLVEVQTMGEAGTVSPPEQGLLVPVDGSAPGGLVEGVPSMLSWQRDYSCYELQESATWQHLWTGVGPHLLTQDCHGTRLENLATRQLHTLVEPERVPIWTAPFDVVVAADQVFAWAMQCFGIGETYCNTELRRLSLATGQRDVVATANKVLPFAVSPDGKWLATADGRFVYLKQITL